MALLSNLPDITPILISLKLALLTSVLLLLIGLPIAYFLSNWQSRFKVFVESLISLPIILPPTVLGFYILIAFSPNSFLGGALANVGIQIPFTFAGILIASLLYSFPFMIQPIQRALEQMPKHYWHISFTLGKSKLETLWRVIIPNIKHAIVTGFILTFAHTMGE